SSWIRGYVQAKRELVALHGLEIDDDEILGSLARRLDGEAGIPARIHARIVPHRLLECMPFPLKNVFGVVERVETRITLRQIERFHKTVETSTVDAHVALEQRA